MESKTGKALRKTKWLDRKALFGPYLCLCLSDEEAKEAAKSLGHNYEMKTQFGRCLTLEREDKLCCIIILNNMLNMRIESALGLIVHEAEHVKQQMLQNIGEDQPGVEIEAYIAQNISQTLMEELYNRVVIKKKKIVRIKMGCKTKKPPKK